MRTPSWSDVLVHPFGRLLLLLSVLLAGCATVVIDEALIVPLETLDQKPKMGRPARAMMPSLLRHVSVSGRVLVEFVVDSEGNVHQARVIEASPPEFADTGRIYFERTKFTPGRKDGRAVATRMQMPFVFHLNQPEGPTYQERMAGVDESAVVPLESLDERPMVLVRPRPVFPVTQRRNGVSGSAVVEFTVDAKGEVSGAHAVEASHPDFGAAAAEAWSRAKFSPGIVQGRAVITRMRMPVVFTLKEDR